MLARMGAGAAAFGLFITVASVIMMGLQMLFGLPSPILVGAAAFGTVLCVCGLVVAGMLSPPREEAPPQFACRHCGQPNRAGDSICRRCGRTVEGPGGDRPVCTSCGVDNELDASFCKSCGSALP